jgi:hypothetical protein
MKSSLLIWKNYAVDIAIAFQRKLEKVTNGSAFLALIFVLFAFPRCSAREISVRLLDARNGHPYAHRLVFLEFRTVRSLALEHIPGFPPLKAETNRDGVAFFHVPDGSPPFIDVLLTDKLYLCSDLLPLELETITRTGLVSHCSAGKGCHCKLGKSTSSLIPTPSQFVLLARPRSLRERLFDRLFPE